MLNMPRNAFSLPDTIDALVANSKSRKIWNTERDRAAMQMQRERRRRQADQPTVQLANLLAEKKPGANASP